MKKKNYSKPSMKVYTMKLEGHLLQASSPYPYPIGYNPSNDEDTHTV